MDDSIKLMDKDTGEMLNEYVLFLVCLAAVVSFVLARSSQLCIYQINTMFASNVCVYHIKVKHTIKNLIKASMFLRLQEIKMDTAVC